MSAHRPFVRLICVTSLLFYGLSSLESQPDSSWIDARLFEGHGAVMLLINPKDGRIISANRAARVFYGYPDLGTMQIDDINMLTDAEVADEMQLAATQQRNFFNFRHRTLTEGIRDVEVYSYPITVNGDAFLYSIIFDVTDRVAAERAVVTLRRTLHGSVAAVVFVILVGLVFMIVRVRRRLDATQLSLAQTESTYRTYVDNAPLGVFVTDQRGRYLEVNSAGCRLTGYSSEELLGMTIADLSHPDDQEKAKEHFQRLREHEDATGELAFQTKSGEKRWWSISATRLSDDRFLGLAEDITERKKDQRNHVVLAGAASRLQAYTGGSLDYSDILHTVCELSGATSAVFTGTGSGSTADVETAEVETEGVHVTVATEQQVFGDLILSMPDGHIVRDRTLLDTYAGMLAITLDRIKTESTNSQLVAEKERLLKEVQHRVKNNMSAMNGLLSLQAYSLSDEAAVAAINEAQGRFQSLGTLYEQLFRGEALDSASLEEYLSVLVRRVVDVFPPVPGLVVEVTAEPQQHSSGALDSSVASTTTDSGVCMLDAKRLSTVGLIVNELITNAMKYAFKPGAFGDAASASQVPEQARLTVKTTCVDGRIEIGVADNGPGIPSSYGQEPGKGFGLGMVRELVEQLDGELRLERNDRSSLGGARVVFSFPH